VILSFGDEATEDLFHGRLTRRTRSLHPDLQRAALRKLDMLNAAHPSTTCVRLPAIGWRRSGAIGADRTASG